MSDVVTHVVWAPEFAAYDFGGGHPMAPVRLELTAALSEELGLFALPQVRVEGAEPAPDEVLATVHERAYIDAVRRLSAPAPAPAPGPAPGPDGMPGEWGLGSDDNPVFVDMHESSARLAGGTVAAVDAVLAGRATRAVNFTGGMHHAMPGRASGFCVYNDPAIGIRRALAAGVDRILYVDVDVHHGDGVERAFWDDPRVTTLSIHETGASLFPGTGFIEDQGGAAASGEAINLPLPAATSDTDWLRALRALVPQIAAAVRPDLVISQHGADSHVHDPLGHLDITLEAQRAAMQLVREVADTWAEGRWIALGGGGYAVQTVVPRSWTHLVAVAAGADIDPEMPVPGDFYDRASDLGCPVPRVSLGAPDALRMGDGHFRDPPDWQPGTIDPNPVDLAIANLRRAVFPLHGLDPFYD